MTYLIIAVDGTATPFIPKKSKPNLEEMQKIVGGFIERVAVPGGEMWVNEEGLLLSLPVNIVASMRAGKTIVGDVLLCTRKKRYSTYDATPDVTS